MKNILSSLVIVLLLSPGLVRAEEPSLATELDNLNMPANQAPAIIAPEKFYSVQTRYSPLDRRLETTIGFAQKVSDTGFITSRELSAGLRYYFNSRWSLGAHASYAFNAMSSSAQKLYNEEGILPKVSYVKNRADLTLRYNLFYGKFRVSMDKVFYFDQYISLGAGMVGFDTGNSNAAVGDLGFAFWMGKHWSTRIGVKDYLFRELTPKGSNLSNHVLVYLDAGYLFGGGA